jgi:hypothetical protein
MPTVQNETGSVRGALLKSANAGGHRLVEAYDVERAREHNASGFERPVRKLICYTTLPRRQAIHEAAGVHRDGGNSERSVISAA